MINTRTPEKIHLAIENKLKNGVTYIDALIDYAREQEIEIETVADIVKRSSTIKEKIRLEGIKNKTIKEEETDITQLCK